MLHPHPAGRPASGDPGSPRSLLPVRPGDPCAWGSFQRQWIGDPLPLTPAQRVGLLAVELAVSLSAQGMGTMVHVLAAAFFAVALIFVHRSFYAMRIPAGTGDDVDETAAGEREITEVRS